MAKCSVTYCPGISGELHRVPAQLGRRNHWSSILGVELRSSQFICDRHFNKNDLFTRTNRLKHGADPVPQSQMRTNLTASKPTGVQAETQKKDVPLQIPGSRPILPYPFVIYNQHNSNQILPPTKLLTLGPLTPVINSSNKCSVNVPSIFKKKSVQKDTLSSSNSKNPPQFMLNDKQYIHIPITAAIQATASQNEIPVTVCISDQSTADASTSSDLKKSSEDNRNVVSEEELPMIKTSFSFGDEIISDCSVNVKEESSSALTDACFEFESSKPLNHMGHNIMDCSTETNNLEISSRSQMPGDIETDVMMEERDLQNEEFQYSDEKPTSSQSLQKIENLQLINASSYNCQSLMLNGKRPTKNIIKSGSMKGHHNKKCAANTALSTSSMPSATYLIVPNSQFPNSNKVNIVHQAPDQKLMESLKVKLACAERENAIARKQILDLKRLLNAEKKKLNRRKNRNIQLMSKIKTFRTKAITQGNIIKSLQQHKISNLFLQKGRIHNDKMKEFALRVSHYGKNHYQYLRESGIPLPEIRTVRRWKAAEKQKFIDCGPEQIIAAATIDNQMLGNEIVQSSDISSVNLEHEGVGILLSGNEELIEGEIVEEAPVSEQDIILYAESDLQMPDSTTEICYVIENEIA